MLKNFDFSHDEFNDHNYLDPCLNDDTYHHGLGQSYITGLTGVANRLLALLLY